MRGSSIQCTMVTAILLAGSLTPPTYAQEALDLEACDIAGVAGDLTCGTYRVFEDRASQTGRMIDIAFVVLHATGEGSVPDPLLYIPGGPG